MVCLLREVKAMKMLAYGLVVVVLAVLAVSCSLTDMSGDIPIDNPEKEVGQGDTGGNTEKEKEPGSGEEPDQVTGFEWIDLSGAQDGDSPEDYGFVVGKDYACQPAFVINDGVIESDGFVGGWLNLDTPEFYIDRSENGGVVVTWEIRYIDDLPARSRERSKFYIQLREDGETRYKFEYKPFLNDGDNRESSLIVDGVKTSANQITVTPSGSEAPWLKFKMELLDTGEVTVYYDYDGYGWTEMIGIVDTSYNIFNGLRFTYRTTPEPRYYRVQLRNLSVLPIDQ
jgi:hypothetical protein